MFTKLFCKLGFHRYEFIAVIDDTNISNSNYKKIPKYKLILTCEDCGKLKEYNFNDK